MTPRERIIAAIHHEPVDIIPYQPFAIEATDPNTEDRIKVQDRFCWIDVGGPYLKAQKQGNVLCFENGARWRTYCNPYWREFFDPPIKEREDVRLMREQFEQMHLPNPHDQSRYEGLEETISQIKKSGFFTTGKVEGLLSATTRFAINMEQFYLLLASNREFAQKIIDRFAEYGKIRARELAKKGIDQIYINDDWGNNKGLMVSPELFRKKFLPHYRDIIDICHSYGAFINLHSHGNIMEIMGDLVEAGFDVINPIGPGDGMDLAVVKEKYGKRITLQGGLSKFIGQMSLREIVDHVEEITRIGSKGGGFILSNEAGIPSEMSKNAIDVYRSAIKTFCIFYGDRNA